MAAKQLKLLSSIAIAGLLMAGCGSGSVRAKKEQRDKAVQTAHLWCEFVNGENNPTDVDVALNLSMAQKCDSDKPFSVSTYKTPSEVQGLVYCCGMQDKNKKEEKAMAKLDTKMDTPAKEAPKKPDNSLPELNPGKKTDLKSDFETPGLPKASGGPSAPSSGAPSTPSNPQTPKAPQDNSYPKIPELDP